jgi:3-dehydroquinate synthase
MTGTEAVVVVAEQRPSGWQVSACDRPGHTALSREYGPANWEKQLEEWLRPFDDAPAAVVLLLANCEDCEYPATETLLPCPVVSLPRRLALAAFAPPDWSRFAVLDSRPGCGLVTRADTDRFYYAESAGSDSADAVLAFGYTRVVTAETRAEFFAEVASVSGEDRIREGAALLAVAALRSHGVCLGSPGGRPALRLARRQSAAYEVVHASVLDPESGCLSEAINGRPALFAVDATVRNLYGRALRNYAALRLGRCAFATVRPGDASKSWSQVAYLCEQAERASLPRDGVIVGVGGGVTLDIAGLAASLYHRGAPYLRVPTTLLGMVDVAVGIKHAINFNGRKSLLGTFYAPLGAINDISFLKTLPRSELANGFSEIIKLGLARDRELFAWVEQYGPRLVQTGYEQPPEWGVRIALRAEYVMMADLQPNLYEQDRRRYPDFGHTFSAAMEEVTRYELPHGAAVAADMLLATILSVTRGICEESVLNRLVALYEALGLLSLPESCTSEVLARGLQAARLHRGGQIHMVVPKALGKACFLDDVTVDEARSALERAASICAAGRRSYASAGR